MGWSVVCDQGILLSYSLVFLLFFVGVFFPSRKIERFCGEIGLRIVFFFILMSKKGINIGTNF